MSSYKITEKDELCPVQKLFNQSFGFYREKGNNIIGKLLTVIDASIVDKQQNESVKSLVKQIFYDEITKEDRDVMAWFLWFRENYELKEGPKASKVPGHSSWAVNAPLIDKYKNKG